MSISRSDGYRMGIAFIISQNMPDYKQNRCLLIKDAPVFIFRPADHWLFHKLHIIRRIILPFSFDMLIMPAQCLRFADIMFENYEFKKYRQLRFTVDGNMTFIKDGFLFGTARRFLRTFLPSAEPPPLSVSEPAFCTEHTALPSRSIPELQTGYTKRSEAGRL